MTLSQEISKQIEQKAKAYAQTKFDDFEGKKGIHLKTILMYAHQSGATEWAGKAQGLVDILEIVHGMSYVVGQPGCTFCDTEHDSMSAAAGYNQAVDNMKKVISTALAKYKEESND